MEQKLKLTNRLKREVRNYSTGSLYRLNAKTADCYAFNLYRNASGKLDFEGGWDWSKSLVDVGSEYLYMLESKEFIKL